MFHFHLAQVYVINIEGHAKIRLLFLNLCCLYQRLWSQVFLELRQNLIQRKCFFLFLKWQRLLQRIFFLFVVGPCVLAFFPRLRSHGASSPSCLGAILYNNRVIFCKTLSGRPLNCLPCPAHRSPSQSVSVAVCVFVGSACFSGSPPPPRLFPNPTYLHSVSCGKPVFF